ncbi:MAG TPA: glycosyltransferase family 2 protein, partial [Burkholderiaceae bacterium]|nr:glycosyltransferase family 2 protein [Burkholderiaceae bacterium]
MNQDPDRSATPWLSVLIPVYNVEPWLDACLASVFSQDALSGVEVLAVDDCATDGSPALLKAWSERHPGQMRVVRHERNSGISATRNTLVEASSGRYLWFLDADDVLMRGAIASLKRQVDAHQPELVLCDFAYLRERQKLKHRLRGEQHVRSFDGPSSSLQTDRGLLMQGLLLLGYLHCWSRISKRSLWNEDLRFPVGRYYEDMAVVPALALRAASWLHVPEVWIGYRQRPGSILATGDTRKYEHMMQALAGLGRHWQEAARSDARIAFAAAHFAARSFIGACRHVHKAGDRDRLP